MTDLTRHATYREILDQPAIWTAWGAQLPVANLRGWIAQTGAQEVWFCGAGTSAYIGDILAAGLEGQPGPRLRSVPTTDIVARPHSYLRGHPKLIVSFGRSGNSTESIGLQNALDALAPTGPASTSPVTPSPPSARTPKPKSSPCLTPPTTKALR
jgi:tagatose-6-phosphate ketose/aldose isomerase